MSPVLNLLKALEQSGKNLKDERKQKMDKVIRPSVVLNGYFSVFDIGCDNCQVEGKKMSEILWFYACDLTYLFQSVKKRVFMHT